jgi:hypothetical protein
MNSQYDGADALLPIVFLQTAEERYATILEASSQTVKAYCIRKGFHYQSYFGIVRGFHPWHATYNRIPLLRRLADDGYRGWVCYIDADAYIVDLDFDMRGYLVNKADIALIARYGKRDGEWWDINAGVFLMNLDHPLARKTLANWSAMFEQITDAQLRVANRWSQVPDDQHMLHLVLQEMPEMASHVIVERNAPCLLNYSDGVFIRQVLRAGGSLEHRAAVIKREVSNVLGLGSAEDHSPQSPSQRDAQVVLPGQTAEAFINSLYRVLLLREPDPGGLESGVRLLEGGASFEAALRSCLGCDEFASKQRQFASTYMRAPRLESNLTTLANNMASDKGTIHGSPPHRYTLLYDLILDRYRSGAINFLELGLAVGGPEIGGPVDRQVQSPSVRMWLSYFPRAHIYGFDISDFSHMKHPRFTFVRGDGGSAADVERLAHSSVGFDVIIDDGSHASHHQQLAFRYLFPKLRPGGTYIIEDLQWQSPAYEGKSVVLPKTRDFFARYFENSEYIDNELLSEEFMQEVRGATSSYASFPAFDGTASVAKLLVLRKAE